jgi:hypothetical protein
MISVRRQKGPHFCGPFLWSCPGIASDAGITFWRTPDDIRQG